MKTTKFADVTMRQFLSMTTDEMRVQLDTLSLTTLFAMQDQMQTMLEVLQQVLA